MSNASFYLLFFLLGGPSVGSAGGLAQRRARAEPTAEERHARIAVTALRQATKPLLGREALSGKIFFVLRQVNSRPKDCIN